MNFQSKLTLLLFEESRMRTKWNFNFISLYFQLDRRNALSFLY